MGRVPPGLRLADLAPGQLAVSEVFGPTVQGEGPTAGQRAAFVRLAHCNLACRWCDTAYTWDWSRHDPAAEITVRSADGVEAALVTALGAGRGGRVVVSGGEPLLQQRALVPLLARCRARGWAVEVETNGTIVPADDLADLVDQFNVSPKLPNSGMGEGRRIKPEALAAFRGLAATGRAVFKFVVTGPHDLDAVAAVVAAHDLAPVWIMPEGIEAAVVQARLEALADPVVERGWNLTPRLHVLLWGNQRAH